jgi:peptide chain release factor
MTKILQISSGSGPPECQWVVAQILKILLDEARGKGINATLLHREEGEENGMLRSASIELDAPNLDVFLKSWVGTIQWIGESQLKPAHKSKNWFVGLAAIDLPEVDFQVREKDILYKAIRSGGPGGQHVNKVSTAIRATHIPTGLFVVANDSRSQIQNKKKALERLIKLVKLEMLNRKIEQLRAANQPSELKRSNPVRTFKGTNFKSQIETKKYKSTRQSLKKELKQVIRDEKDF